jgi:hypothetical protein
LYVVAERLAGPVRVARECHDLVAPIAQRLDEGSADQSGGAGDYYAHDDKNRRSGR